MKHINTCFFILFFIFSLNLLSTLPCIVSEGELCAATIYSKGSGAFNDPAIWTDALIPGVSDTAVIASGDTVTLDIDRALAGLRIMSSAKFDNDNNLLTLINPSFGSGGQINYTVYGEHDITGNMLYRSEGDLTYLKMTGTSSGTGGLISGIGQLMISTCIDGINGTGADTISGIFTIPDAEIVFKFNACALSYARWVSYATIKMGAGNFTIDGSVFYNLDTVKMTTAHIQLRSNGNIDNYGSFILSNGNVDYQGTGRFWNMSSGMLTLQAGSINMGNDGKDFRNNGIINMPKGSILSSKNLNTIKCYNNEGGVLNIGGEIFANAPNCRFIPHASIANTVNYMGSGTQKIRKPVANNVGSPLTSYWHLICSGDTSKTIDGYNLTIKGNLSIRDSASLDASKDGGTTNYDISIAGNWYNSSTAMQAFIPRDKKVSFNGTIPQTITSSTISGGETFNDLVIDNSDTGLVLTGGNIKITNTLTITNGLLHAVTDTVWVTNIDPFAIIAYTDTTYINGNLKRSISPSGGSYDFPVGNADAYELANVNFVGADTIGSLTVNFSNPADGTGLALTDANDAEYKTLLNCGGTMTNKGNAKAGVWNISPGKGSAIYDLSLYGRHFDNPGMMYHSIVKRNNNLVPWEFSGTYLAATLKTDTLIARRTCLTGFYQFAIANSNTNTPLNTTPLSFKSDDNVICGNKCIDFISKNNFSATSWRWIRSKGASSSTIDSTSQNPSNICFNDLGNYDVRLIASTACDADTLEQLQYIKVNYLPSASIIGASSICSGERLELTATGTGDYKWSTGATSSAITESPLINTTYSLVVSSVSDGGGCSDTTFATIAVTTTPTATINANTRSICSGESAVLTGTGAANTYLWSTGETGTVLTISPMTDETYTLTLSNGICFDNEVITINVTTTPTASIAGETSICSGKKINLTEKSTLQGLSYLWSTGSTDQVINAIPLINTTFSVVVSKGSCKDMAAIEVSVTTSPTAAVTADKTVLCSNDSALLSSTTTAQAYLWSTGETTTAIHVRSSDTYTLSLSNGSASGRCSDNHSLLITVIPMPTASISGPSTVCSGNSTNLNASSGGGGGSTYLWSTGETSTNINITPLINTAYAVTVSNGDGLCMDTTSRSITLITPVPADAGPDITIAIGLDTVLTANNGSAWSWSPNVRLDCNTCQNPIAAPFQTTGYTVTVTDINGCVTSDSVKVYVIPCADLFVPKAFSPNNDGQNDVLYLRGTDCIDKVFSFTIYNRWGEKVFETRDIKAGWDGSQTKLALPNEVFIYYLDGLSINGDAITKTGNVTLMK